MSVSNYFYAIMTRKCTLDSVVARFVTVHGNKYDYSKVVYEASLSNVCIHCPDHGDFHQTPANHLQGKGCYQCGRIASGLTQRTNAASEVLAKFRSVHGDVYDYSRVAYVSASKKVVVGCKYHGDFLSTPNNHLQGYGCPKCGHRISVGERDWLAHLGIPDDPAHRQVILIVNGTKFVVDGYMPDTATVYEYNGDYWHGNPTYYLPEDYNKRCGKTFGELYLATLSKYDQLRDAGFKVIHIWGSEWDSTNFYPSPIPTIS